MTHFLTAFAYFWFYGLIIVVGIPIFFFWMLAVGCIVEYFKPNNVHVEKTNKNENNHPKMKHY